MEIWLFDKGLHEEENVNICQNKDPITTKTAELEKMEPEVKLNFADFTFFEAMALSRILHTRKWGPMNWSNNIWRSLTPGNHNNTPIGVCPVHHTKAFLYTQNTHLRFQYHQTNKNKHKNTIRNLPYLQLLRILMIQLTTLLNSKFTFDPWEICHMASCFGPLIQCPILGPINT